MAPVSGFTLPEARTVAGRPLRLADRARNEWTREARVLNFPDYRDLDAWTNFREISAKLAERHLPTHFLETLRDFFTPCGAPYLILENLPVDPTLPATPTDGMRPRDKQAISEAVMSGLLGKGNEILAFLNEKNGAPIQEIAPIPGMERAQSNAGRVRFGFHSDNAFLPRRFRQKGIILYGLRNESAATLVLTADQIAEAAPVELAVSLAKPIFRHACPASFSLSAFSLPCPILWRDELGLLRVSAASSSIEPLTPEASEALDRFRKLVMDLEPTRVVVRPGTALLFKDDRVLHGRDSFAGPRWLQRAYFTDSLDALRKATRSSPYAFAFDAAALLCA